MTLTEFGKAIRKARIDANENLLSMAKAIGVSSSFLSAVENGKKKLSQDKGKKIILFLKNKGIKIDGLEELIHISNGYIPIGHLPAEQKKLIAWLANRVITKNQLNSFLNLLANEQGEDNGYQ